ncbi:prepilin-type N-terminal cleavage/methylation domain-containing protein [Nitrospirota bacterium]
MAMKNNRGFTLIELILALTITALVVGILLSVLRLGYRSQEKGDERSEISQRMRVLGDRTSWLLRGAYPYIFTDPDDERYLFHLFRGEADSVEFVTTSIDPYSDDVEDTTGLKLVRLFMDDEGLKLRQTVFFMGDEEWPDEPHEYVIGPAVTDMSIEYLDRDQDDGDESWDESWDTEETNYLPIAIRVMLTFRHKDKEIEMPPITAALRTGLSPVVSSTSSEYGSIEVVTNSTLSASPRNRWNR